MKKGSDMNKDAEWDLFDTGLNDGDALYRPLADRMRPDSLHGLVGQDHIGAKGGILYQSILNDLVFSMILWGPPGCGKTTLAGIIAKETRSHFVQISAVLSGVKEIRKVISDAKKRRKLYKKRTILFVDEIHRFNKAQQDAFLHHVETGIIVLVGATTENPSFEVIPALVSRCRVILLKRLGTEAIQGLLTRALADKDKGLGALGLRFSDEALTHIALVSDGDARIALTNLEAAAFYWTSGHGNSLYPALEGLENDTKATDENAVDNPDDPTDKPSKEISRAIDIKDVEVAIQKKALRYDKSGDQHFNLISAFHKSLRGSDPDASLYWLARMLEAGEDPFYILRRMIRFATEDVGMADPGALTMAVNAMESFRFLGHPEGEDALVQAAIYLATAPKSNAVYTAYKQVKKRIQQTGYLPVPLHIRNASTGLMKAMDYGKGYKYAHDYKGGYVAQDYLPEEMEHERFYHPTDRGYERTVKQRIEAWIALKKNKGHSR